VVMRDRFLRALGLGCALSALTAASAGAATSTTSTDRFASDAAGDQTVVRSADGAVSTALGRVSADTLGVSSGSATTLARAAVDRYATMLGLASGAQLRQRSATADAQGTTVQYDQVARDVPVYDGRVLVRIADGAAAVTAITASVARDAGTAPGTPAISPDVAKATATDGVADADVLSGPQLVVYSGVPFGSTPTTLAYVTDVRSTSQPLRKVVVVDATSGKVVDTLDRVETAKNRSIYDARGLQIEPGWLVRSEGQGATGDKDADNAYNYTGATYDYYQSNFGRDSYDNAGARLVSTVHYGVGYQNAFWDGTQMVYGDGFPVNDVTAHELTHAVTERTAGLEYADQSGALNEAISDMAGWDLDPGDSTMGEDLSIGAIRDMRNPGAYGQPATASQYVCTSSDNGGVHTNSGIPNKVYANLVDGLGRGTAAQVRYRAQTTYLTPQASFADARAAFVSAAADVGANTTTTANAWQAQGVTATWQPPC
jgi:Zn-dependent metalloprotease